MVEERGFEPLKAKPADLQSALVDRLSTPPLEPIRLTYFEFQGKFFDPSTALFDSSYGTQSQKMVLNEGLEPPTY